MPALPMATRVLLGLLPVLAKAQTLTLEATGSVRQPAAWSVAWHPSGENIVSSAAWDLDLWQVLSGWDFQSTPVRTTAQDAVALSYSRDGNKVAVSHGIGPKILV